MKKMLIAYYSWSNGNTKRISEALQQATGADLVRIKTVQPYEGTYDEVVALGKREADSGYEPAIQPLSVLIEDYDIIAVGTPTWWYTMAPAVKTFLRHTDFAKKTVIPFMTNGGWPGHVIQDMKAACKGAKCVCEKEIRFDSEGGANLITSEDEIKIWIEAVKQLL